MKSLSIFKSTGLLTFSVICAFFALSPKSIEAQVIFTSVSDIYNENFAVPVNASAPRPWTDNSTLVGWYGRSNNATATEYLVSAGSNGNGGLMAYAPDAPSANPAVAFGSLTTNLATANLLAVQFLNNTGSTLTSLTMEFDQLQWFAGNGAAADVFTASYRMGGTTPTGGTWTPVSELNMEGFVSGTGALATPISTNITHTLTDLNWEDGQSIWFRWIDLDVPGGDAGAGFSNMTVTVVPEPSFYAMLVGLSALLVVGLRRKSRK